MNDTKEGRQTVYEIGYLLATSIPEEKVPGEAEALKKAVTDAGAEVIAEEAPHRERLQYTMRVKTVSGAYEKYDEAYFGWIKFELASNAVEALKEAVESRPSVLRMILIATVRENTYLGKRAPGMADHVAAGKPLAAVAAVPEDIKAAPPASIEEMDKSINALVKEA